MAPKTTVEQFDVPVSVDNLPSPDTKRWHTHRKAQVVAGVHKGLISLEDACRRYRLSAEEFASWQRLIEDHGLLGLRVTYGKRYRKPGVDAAGRAGSELRPDGTKAGSS